MRVPIRYQNGLRGMAAVAVLLTSGCIRDAAEMEDSSDLDELRSLPYASFSKEVADSTKMGVVHHVADRAYPGYSLYTQTKRCSAELVDMSGELTNSWSAPRRCAVWNRSELLPSGDLLVIGRDAEGRYLMKLDWAGEVLWKRILLAHHDVEATPRDQMLALTLDHRPVELGAQKGEIRDNSLTLLDASGQVLESKSLFDLIAAEHEELLEWVRPKRKGKSSDLLHANSVEWMRRLPG